MIRRLSSESYYDEPYGPGTHCIVLVMPDELAVAAAPAVKQAAELKPSVTFWVCSIETPEQAEAVQAIRYPQYRLIRDGQERYCHVGLLEYDELLECFDKLED